MKFGKHCGYPSGNFPIAVYIRTSCRISDRSLNYSDFVTAVPESFPSPFTGQTTSDHLKNLTTDTSQHSLHIGSLRFV